MADMFAHSLKKDRFDGWNCGESLVGQSLLVKPVFIA